MLDLRELYQQLILDHNKNPRNFGEITNANHSSDGRNPLCGDHIQLYVNLKGELIQDISFQGSGCAISKASASMMTSLVKGKTCEEASTLFKQFQEMVTGHSEMEPNLVILGKLAVFAGVREFPARVKCATLSWHTLKAALNGNNQPVTTE